MRFITKYKNIFALINGLLLILAGIFKLINLNIGTEWALIIAGIVGVVPIGMQAISALKIKVISIDVLVTIAVIGAILINEPVEAAVVTFLFLFGNYLEQKTLAKTRSAIKELAKITPKTALKIVDQQPQIVEIDEVEIGDQIQVNAGMQAPVDGEILYGDGYFNESAVTGESKFMNKSIGDSVFAGTSLENGSVIVKTGRVGEDTVFGKIVELVEDAQDDKSTQEQFIDHFSKYYTPIILLLAIVVGLITRNLQLAITILVLGCPGALVIGVPVSNVAGIGRGAKQGVLIKGGQVMSTFKKVDTMIFDKTGTLTVGRPAVTTVVNFNGEQKVALEMVAAVEQKVSHPLADAIVKFVAPTTDFMVNELMVIKGRGVAANVNKVKVLIGNQAMMREQQINVSEVMEKQLDNLSQNNQTVVIVAIDGVVRLIIGIKDVIRPEVAESLIKLRKLGIKRMVMLTGDTQISGEIIAKEARIDEIHGNLLPADKAEFIKQLQANGHKVAFVGDGINDSPSLKIAEIGIAMGNGTDVAIETSDVVLLKSDFGKLVESYRLSQRTVRNMYENIGIALGTVLLLFIGLWLGFIYMASGMLIHEISILIVVVNAMRLLSVSKNLTDINYLSTKIKYNK
ncbi:cadmium-exporting ATPase [Paucilactobacillus oligofermentans DSM 15707 = LMG 22743]|uniref:Cd(2+)-exporting ATPase n=1 Tax=Paucilactobacillus oligofermentans DSM 15707 = LMG 22743 TaxID=1423778 RepID=A0A0R1RFI2_9LACO|nr:heavy metal translocating P-type ATPase [Paucilactobacillus oligofermentans]KRL55663.1 cadmium-exporting ATPase [Paucilactobacillus oligofermentans DSM 15707 = LMG 22743]CUS25348.1 Cation-transporting P-type ATPase [Paucilactobacillus oligofermentans DSM 15707 = LMG 22743]